MKSLGCNIKTKYGYETICNFFLFLTLFSIILDPGNTIFRIKNASFVILFILMIPYLDLKKTYIFMLILLIPIVTLAIGLIFPNAKIDISYALQILKSFFFLSFIFFIKKESFLKIFHFFYVINFLTAIFFVCMWILWIIFFDSMMPVLIKVRSFFDRNENLVFGIMYGRKFLGITTYGLFFSTAIFSTVCLSYSIYKWIFNHDRKYLFPAVIFFMYLFNSGTRANLLSSVMILGIIFIYKLYRNKKLTLFSLFLCIFSIVALIVIYKLMTEVGDKSLNIKLEHKNSYLHLFFINPLRYFLIGDGPGALFYSSGFDNYVLLTELSYFDLIRRFGLINTTILLIIFLLPLFKIYCSYPSEFFFCMLVGYIAFYFIAGTNPYFLGSTGFSVFVVYVYIAQNNILKQNEISE